MEEDEVFVSGTASSRKVPNSVKVMEILLQSMGVGKFNPRVPVQLLDFIYRYSTEILQEAQLYAEHANSKQLRVEDLQLAVEAKSLHQFTYPPDREAMEEIAGSVNSIPLPSMSEKHGLRLPPERYALTGTNFQVLPNKIVVEKTREDLSTTQPSRGDTSLNKREVLEPAPSPVAVIPGTNIVAPPSVKQSAKAPTSAVPPPILATAPSAIKAEDDDEDYDMS